MRKLRSIIFASLLGLVMPVLAPLLPVASAATGPSIYFVPSTTTAGVNSNFSLALRLAANGTAVNTVNVTLNLPTDQVTFQGLDKSGSFFDIFLPATPAASGTKLNFSAASLSGGTTTGDVLIGTLTFSAKVSTGTADISLTDSQVANQGKPTDVEPADATVTFSDQTTTLPANPVNITNIKVSGVTLKGGTVSWSTAVPTTGSVDYGGDTGYGLTTGSPDLSLTHSVDLGSKFSAKSLVHFRVTSVDANGQRQSSADQSFSTLGYTVRVKVVNASNKPLSKVSVLFSDAKRSAVTDANGYATVANVAPGNQQVIVNGGKSQSIAVKATTDATTPQQFTLTGNTTSTFATLLGVLFAALLVAALCVMLYGGVPRFLGHTPESAATPEADTKPAASTDSVKKEK